MNLRFGGGAVACLLVVLAGCSKHGSRGEWLERARLGLQTPVAKFGFDEASGSAVLDTSGNGHNTTLAGQARVTGKYGGALSFSGNFLTIADSNLLDLTTGMTLSAWVRPTIHEGDWATAIYKEGEEDPVYALMAENPLFPHAPVAVAFSEESVGIVGAEESEANPGLPDGVWSHIAATYDAANLRLWVNGDLVALGPFNEAIATSSGALRVGGNDLFGEFFTGRIDEVRIYDRALSEDEIEQDLHSPINPSSPDTTAPSVTLTAPSNGQPVAGKVPLAATATDNISVAGVKFFVDGTLLGEDEWPPFALEWNSAPVANGTHTVRAEARDAAGNTQSSATINVNVKNDSLVTAYNFNEGTGSVLNDVSGNGNHGTRDGQTWVTGKYGQALRFAESFVTVPDAQLLDLTNKMTLSAWVKPNVAFHSNWPTVVMKEHEDGGLAYVLYAQWLNAHASICLGNSEGDDCVHGGATPQAVWTHIAGTYDGNVFRMYVNGNPAGSAATPQFAPAAATTGALRIGGNAEWANEYFSGDIDDVRIYNRALTEAEIEQDMATPLTGGTGCGSGCSDGNACNGVETCVANSCVSGTPPAVDDGNPCTTDSCHPINGATHVAVANGTACTDSNACTASDTCQSGSCSPGSAVPTDDGNPCTTDSCHPTNGVTHVAVANGTSCTDADLCTQASSCQSGTCTGSNPVTCTALDQCHNAGTCNPATGVCSNPNKPNGTACSDGNACTASDTCQSGSCASGSAVPTDDGNVCTTDGCDPGSGVTHTPVAAGTPCLDANLCNGAEACNAIGFCAAGAPLPTDDGNPCTADGCNPGTGATHTPVAAGTSCADGDLCDGAEACNAAGACQAGTPPVLDDGNPCTADSCDGQQGVIHAPEPAGLTCSDSNLCNGAETCNGSGVCSAGTPPVLDDGNVCTVDACDPGTGVSHTPIPGCDTAPPVAGGRLESKASLIGRVVTDSGVPATGYSVQVFDAPATGPARTDVEVSATADGSFRARLTTFPEVVTDATPPLHVVVRIEAPNFLHAVRDTYLRPGDIADLGKIVVTERDPAVTMVGPAGGVASDSQGLFELTIPPGALSSTKPIRITPMREREQFPYPLPDSTVTLYGAVFEPAGTEFAVPITLRIENARNVPTDLHLPVGVADEKNGRWEHLGQGVWDGQRFRTTLTHFSTIDMNPGRVGRLLYRYLHGADPNKSDAEICTGSTTSLAAGSLRQRIALPGYQRHGRDYGVTLVYDSGLAGSRVLGGPPTGQSHSGAMPRTALRVPVTYQSVQAECSPPGTGSSGGCDSGLTCSLSTVAFPAGVFRGRSSMLGSEVEHEMTNPLLGNQMGFGHYVDLPMNADGTFPASGYHRRSNVVSLVATGGTACIASGGVFGITQSNRPARPATNIEFGPVARLDTHELVYHRRSSPFGAGWALDELHEAFRTPDGQQVDIVSGSGRRETFVPRATPRVVIETVVPNFQSSFLSPMAQDPVTGEIFILYRNSDRILRINANGSTTQVLGGLFTDGSTTTDLAVAYVGSERRFVVARHHGLFEVGPTGSVQQLASRQIPPDQEVYDHPHLAAAGPVVYYTSGLDNTIKRVRLDDPGRVLESFTATSGDLRLDPDEPAGQLQFDGPRGLATAPDGSLYVACTRRHAVYRLTPQTDGTVGADSAVARVLGNGRASTLAQIGAKHPALDLEVDSPLRLSVAADGTLFAVTQYGIVVYEPAPRTAFWFAFDSRMKGSSFTNVRFNEHGILALNPGAMLTETFNRIIEVTTPLSSQFEPTRTVSYTSTGITLTDTTADMVETYDYSDSTRAYARLRTRAARTGEAVASFVYDSSGKLDRIEDPAGSATRLFYDGSGKIDRITTGAGATVELGVVDGDLTSVQMPTGEEHQFDYELHRMTSARDPRGGIAQYTYAENGTLASTQRPGGGTHAINASYATAPTLAANGRLLFSGQYTDDRGLVHQFTTNAAGGIERETFTADGQSFDVRKVLAAELQGPLGPNNPPFTRTNEVLRVTRTTLNGLALTPTTLFDDRGRPIRELTHAAFFGFPSGSSDLPTFSAAYDALGRLSFIEPEGTNVAWVNERDTAGRIARQLDFRPGAPSGPTGRQSLFTWRADGQPATITEHGVTTTLGYRSSDGLLETSSDVTGSLSLTYDAAGNVTSTNDGATTVSMTYDASNRLRTVTDAGGNVTTMGYAQPGCGCAHQDRVTSLHTPDLAANQQWSFDYDPDGRLVVSHDPQGFTESYAYTPSGDLAQSTDRLSRSTLFSYDQLGRPSTTLDPTNRVGTFAYPSATSNGWVGPSVFAASSNSSPAPTGMTASLADGQYQVGMNIHRPGGYPAQVEYYRDATFALSFGRQFDVYQRLKFRDDRFGIPIESSEIFPGGNTSTSAPFRDEIHTYNTDTPLGLFNRSVADYAEESRYENNERDYNPNFDLTFARGWSFTNGSDVGYGFGRDVAGRLTSITSAVTPGGAGFGVIPTFTMSYRPNGQVLTAGSDAGMRQFAYDTRGLVDTLTLTFRPSVPQSTALETEGVFDFDYDAVGRNTLLVYPDGHRRVQEWDELGRLTSRCYEYPGVAPTRCYTAEYDAVGNPVVLGDPERNCNAVYDDLDRLRSFTCSDGTSESYEYNALGALSVHAGAAVDHQRPRLQGGGLASAGIPANHGGHAVTLDGGGRIGSLLGATLKHNKRTKLIEVPSAGMIFSHDSFERLFLRKYPKAGGQQIELYGYDGDNIASITRRITMPSGPVGLAQGFVYEGVDQPLWMFDRELQVTVYFELDTTGNVRRLRGGRKLGTGTVASDLGGYKYTAFGRLLPADAGTPAPQVGGQPLDQPLRWQARFFHNVAGGIYDFRSRVWSPELGAFLEADEFGFLTRTGTLWSWPGQNPLRYRDPSGRIGIHLGASGSVALPFLALFGVAPAGWGHSSGIFIDFDPEKCELSGGFYANITELVAVGGEKVPKWMQMGKSKFQFLPIVAGVGGEFGAFAYRDEFKGNTPQFSAGYGKFGGTVGFNSAGQVSSVQASMGPGIGSFIGVGESNTDILGGAIGPNGARALY